MKESVYKLKTQNYPKPTRWLWMFTYVFFPFLFLTAIYSLSTQITHLYNIYENVKYERAVIVESLEDLPDVQSSLTGWRHLLQDYVPETIFVSDVIMDVAVLIITLFSLFFALVVFLNLRKFSYKGFRLNKAFLWYFACASAIVNGICFIQYTYELGVAISNVIVCILFSFFNLMYFKNRRDLFASESFQPEAPEPSPTVFPVPAPQESPALFCHKCGARLPSESAFCPKCGAKIS